MRPASVYRLSEQNKGSNIYSFLYRSFIIDGIWGVLRGMKREIETCGWMKKDRQDKGGIDREVEG